MSNIRSHIAKAGTTKLAICHAFKRRNGERFGSQTCIEGRELQAPYRSLFFNSLAEYRAWAKERGGKVVAEVEEV